MSDRLHVVKPGDRVFVNDPALLELRTIMRDALGKEPPPNHHGTVQEVRLLDGERDVLILFDDGAAAPYPVDDVFLLEGGA